MTSVDTTAPPSASNLHLAFLFSDTELAKRLGTKREIINRTRHGFHALTAERAFALARVQQNLQYLQDLARRHGILVSWRPSDTCTQTPLELFAEFMTLTYQIHTAIKNAIERGAIDTQSRTATDQLIDEAHRVLETMRDVLHGIGDGDALNHQHGGQVRHVQDGSIGNSGGRQRNGATEGDAHDYARTLTESGALP